MHDRSRTTLDTNRPEAPPANALISLYGHLDGTDLLHVMLRDQFPGRIAVVSSFGSESAVLLDLVAAVDPATPVIFLDTRKHFGETLRYRDELTLRLGLTDVRSVRPDADSVRREDPDGMLWRTDPDACCALRKVRPLAEALAGFDAWVTGRKRFQGETRAAVPVIESSGRHVKINPLARWSPDDIVDWAAHRDLPAHPLVAEGFGSIGCMPCTDRIQDGEDARAGRWRGAAKTECGIHAEPEIRR